MSVVCPPPPPQCECRQDRVSINMDAFVEKYQVSRLVQPALVTCVMWEAPLVSRRSGHSTATRSTDMDKQIHIRG